jgi:hypothetical protein
MRWLGGDHSVWVRFVAGTGLMYINNGPGLVAMALFSRDNPEYDVGKLAKIQAAQVSIISLWNCSGFVLPLLSLFCRLADLCLFLPS